MTPTDLKAARLRLGLTQEGLARALSRIGFPRSLRTVQGWESGLPGKPIPAWLSLALDKLDKGEKP